MSEIVKASRSPLFGQGPDLPVCVDLASDDEMKAGLKKD